MIIIQQMLLELKNVQGYNYNNPKYLASMDEEIFSALQLVTAVLNAGIISYTIVDMLRYAIQLALYRKSNYFICISTFQAIYTCMLSYATGPEWWEDDLNDRVLNKEEKIFEAKLEKERNSVANVQTKGTNNDNPVKILLKETLINAKLPPIVLRIMGAHCSSLTLQHFGLMILRYVIRQPFCTRGEMQDYFEDKDDEYDDDEEEEDEIEGDDATEIQTAGLSRQLEKWHDDVWTNKIHHIQEEDDEVDATTYVNNEFWTLTSMMFYCGDTHMQSTEIVEQLLLLIDHLGRISFLCRVTLLERGIERIMNRVIDTNNHNTYLMALVACCNETLARMD